MQSKLGCLLDQLAKAPGIGQHECTSAALDSSRWFDGKGLSLWCAPLRRRRCGGRELQIAAMFVDLRESTRLATGRLPFDALFIFDRYIQVVTQAIRRNGGHATSIAGDGVMSVFGVDETVSLNRCNSWAIRAMSPPS